MGAMGTCIKGAVVVLGFWATILFLAFVVFFVWLAYTLLSPKSAEEDEEIREWTEEDNELEGCTFIDGEEG